MNRNRSAFSGRGNSERVRLILTGPVIPTLARLTLPVITVIAAQTFVAVLEAYWVSRLGTDAVAGVSLVLPLLVLMGTMSNGGIGGGVSSAVSRALGAGREADTDALLLHAVLVAIVFGAMFTVGTLVGGPFIYATLGGTGAVLANALTFSTWVFGSAVIIWVVNLLASAMRGAGDVRLPALVSFTGVVVLIPLSPVLIFGVGPLPGLGLAGAGVATSFFYVGAMIAYLRHLIWRRGALTLRLAPLEGRHFRAILGVGLVSAAGTLVASLTAVALTGTVAMRGAEALAGYGIGSRVDSLLVPLLFGLGSGVVTMVGTATGAGDHVRAGQVASRAAAASFVATGMVGTFVALDPGLWMNVFTTDGGVREAGSVYLRVAGPFYGFFGAGLLLYFASQGRSNMKWPFIASAARLLVVAGGGYALARSGAGLSVVFSAVGAGSVLFGGINAFGFYRSIRDLSLKRSQSPATTR